MLYRVLQQHLETFLEHRIEEGRPVPFFIERELRRFLDCADESVGPAWAIRNAFYSGEENLDPGEAKLGVRCHGGD